MTEGSQLACRKADGCLMLAGLTRKVFRGWHDSGGQAGRRAGRSRSSGC